MFDYLFRPRAIAVAGASARRVNPARNFIDRQRAFGYEGPIYVVLREEGRIPGATVLQNWKELPDDVDYGFVALPASHAHEVVEQWAGRVRFAQVFSSGFREIGPSGCDLENQLVAKAKQGGVRLIGPNCWGIYAPEGGLTFGGPLARERGGIALVSQSGTVGAETAVRICQTGARFWGAVSIGNAADVGVEELVAWLASHPDVTAIGIYCEETKDGRRLLDALARCQSNGKRVAILKGGYTQPGGRATASHTGSMAGDGLIWKGVVEQHGARLCHSADELSAALAGFDRQRLLSKEASQNLEHTHDAADDEQGACCIVGPGGGVGIQLADGLTRHGVRLAEFPPELVDDLKRVGFPPGTSVMNPVDLSLYALQMENGQLFRRALTAIASSASVRTVLVHLNLSNILTLLNDGEKALEALVAAIGKAVQECSRPITWCVLFRLAEGPAPATAASWAAEKLTWAGALVFWTEQEAIHAIDAVDASWKSTTGTKSEESAHV